jgi:hypothetical protein
MDSYRLFPHGAHRGGPDRDRIFVRGRRNREFHEGPERQDLSGFNRTTVYGNIRDATSESVRGVGERFSMKRDRQALVLSAID